MSFALHLNHTSLVILELAAMLLSAFGLSRVTKLLKLPNVTGYILSGILIGPHCLKWIDSSMVESMSFITDVALAFIAFGVGKYFTWDTLKSSGTRVLVITLLEALAAAAAITAAMLLIFDLPLSFSLLLGAIGAATAPASTLMTIRQYKAKGHFVDTILQVVALDDAVALLAFSVCATVSQVAESPGQLDAASILLPIAYNLLAVALGVGMAYLLKWSEKRVHSSYNRLLMVVILLLTLAGLCAAVDVSPLLACMALGMVHANISSEDELLFKTVDKFTPPVLTFFFVVSGMRLSTSSAWPPPPSVPSTNRPPRSGRRYSNTSRDRTGTCEKLISPAAAGAAARPQSRRPPLRCGGAADPGPRTRCGCPRRSAWPRA